MTPVDALTQWPFAIWLRNSPYAYPTLETLHIIAIATLFGTILMVDVALLRAQWGIEKISDWMRQLLPWTLAGFMLAAMTGSLMFLANAHDLIGNRAFVLKMMLLFIAGANAAILHSRGHVDARSGLTRVQAALSIVIWLAVITCGRWIAYW